MNQHNVPMFQRMIKGQYYRATDPDLYAIRREGRKLADIFNSINPDDHDARQAAFRDVVGSVGDNPWAESIFRVDYGCNITIGDNFYANYNCTLLDVAPITIGDFVMLGPGVQMVTSLHPLAARARRSTAEYARPITVGDNVWLGAGVIVNPGVTIGSNVVIGSGSVVTRDIPDNVMAVGNPCRILRDITEQDEEYWESEIAQFNAEFPEG